MYICLSTFLAVAVGLSFHFLTSKYFLCGLFELLLAALQLLSYTATALINPGMPRPKPVARSRLEAIKGDGMLYCKTCNVEREAGRNVAHCSDCDVCVEGFDHHCPWTGKCIGRRNVVPFYVFLVTTAILIYYIMFSSIFCLYSFNAPT
eukprot:TRINITY_DN4508_c0_g2_i2.p1 TRINITY_DN4508_c0_g2~~TRINITY_DN4508_c0_g2_i2.p1  ORF type:complete len:149 (+),score=35.28 TRINITY_DN4508_c0_g2_i2:388-834(+)